MQNSVFCRHSSIVYRETDFDVYDGQIKNTPPQINKVN